MSVFGKGNSNSGAIMGVNQYGFGVVNTWDKAGNSTGEIPNFTEKSQCIRGELGQKQEKVTLVPER